MTQLRRHSLLESCLNTASGFLVSYLAWPIVCRWVLHMPFHAGPGLEVVGFFTLLSIARNYLWRRRRPPIIDESVWRFDEKIVTPAVAIHLRETLLRPRGSGYQPRPGPPGKKPLPPPRRP